MAKKILTSSKNGKLVSAKPVVSAPTVTAVRNSAIPPKSAAPAIRKAALTHDQIALAAYYIWKSGIGGSQEENWFRAEGQLRGI